MNKELQKAFYELGKEEFDKHFREVFGIPCLDYVETIVINLPSTCYANCSYCIDKKIKNRTYSEDKFLEVCERCFSEFENIENICITGGSLSSVNFNKLLKLIKAHYPKSFVTYNTNGIGLDETYKSGIDMIDYINLHRNSVDEEINHSVFRSKLQPLTISEAKELFGDKLVLRVTIDENFDLDDYAKLGIPMYLNRMLPGGKETDSKYLETLEKLNITNRVVKRRNVYLTTDYKGTRVRICCGDSLSNHVPNRKPTYLNVAIIHRSGVISGSWYEDDKTLFTP